jgi:methionyl aminopeptidase
MARAGVLVAKAHEEVAAAVAPGVSTKDLDQVAEKVIRGGGGIPSFVGYAGIPGVREPFPATLCTSVNEQIVHGIPSDDVVLKEGDLVKIDCGAIIEGFHADSAATWIVGGEDTVAPEVAELVRTTREGLWAGLAAAVAGNRLGDVGAAIAGVAEPHGYGVVQEYVGHGIGRALHEEPSVPNYGVPGRGHKLSRGWVLAIEPMFNLGTHRTKTLEDGWTVVTEDGAMSAHWEHTVAITDDGPWILTARSDEPEYALPDAA